MGDYLPKKFCFSNIVPFSSDDEELVKKVIQYMKKYLKKIK